MNTYTEIIEKQATIHIRQQDMADNPAYPEKYFCVWVEPIALCIESKLFVPESVLDSYIQDSIIAHVQSETWINIDQNKLIHWNFSIDR